jgi:CHAT domain-containing protein
MAIALRRSLDPSAATLADIPPYDLKTAYKLYAELLEPVKSGWTGANQLLVVPHDALAELPFALLTTASSDAKAGKGDAVFANYRQVPWLIRQLAVTQLPSVASLATLRRPSSRPAAARPFIGFGDPWFSAEEAAEAARETPSPPPTRVASAGTTDVAMRGLRIRLRSVPRTETMNSAQLSMLPRLPETADEVREVAVALKADPQTDVFLGLRANERTVETTPLDDRRVVMFATHGLVPGDLDGLNEPALALTDPRVAHVDGTGLLTVGKILGLRLNADWVVLSACNTAAGDGAGAEAVSGLGLAFFYAGSRALLVSNWPVETNAARQLTTELFRREAATPGMARSEALRQAMLSLIDGPGRTDPATGRTLFSYAHPIFWAPFSLVGDGGGRHGN